MTTREQFLGRLRSATGERAPADTTGEPVPPVRYAVDRSGLTGFTESWTALGGTVETVTDLEAAAAAVEAWTAGKGPLMVVNHPDLAGIPRDIDWPDCDLDVAPDAGCGVVRADAAVAQTGSVVVSSTTNHGRSVSLLPLNCVFVFRRDEIVDDPGDILRADFGPDGPPSQLVLIGGPSRSGDIEMSLTTGVHGPGVVHAVVVTG